MNLKRLFSKDPRLLETFVSRKTLARGVAVDFLVDTVRLPDGKKATREYLDHPGAVGVVPFIDKKTIIMVRQYRHPVGEVTLEIPAGKRDRGEGVMTCVKRELHEETGCTAKKITPLVNCWPTPAFANELIYLFMAEKLTRGQHHPDADEFLHVVPIPFKDALSLVKAGRIKDSKTMVALLSCALFKR